LRNVKVK